MQFTTVKSKEKDYGIYLKSDKLVHSNYEHEKNVSLLFGSGKNWFLAISSLTNTVTAIWREKKVDPCYLETKKCSLQLLGARKKIKTLFKVRKTGLQQLRGRNKILSSYFKVEKVDPSYFELHKHCRSYLEREKSGSLLFGDKKCSSQLLGARKKIMTCI